MHKVCSYLKLQLQKKMHNVLFVVKAEFAKEDAPSVVRHHQSKNWLKKMHQIWFVIKVATTNKDAPSGTAPIMDLPFLFFWFDIETVFGPSKPAKKYI